MFRAQPAHEMNPGRLSLIPHSVSSNVLVRYLVQDDAAQARRAAKEIEAGSDAGEIYFIADVVVCELVWVLDQAYG